MYPKNRIVCIHYKPHIQNGRILIITEIKEMLGIRSLLYYSNFCMSRIFQKTCFT